MKLKGKHGRRNLLVGFALLALGTYFIVYSSSIPPHLKVYFVVGNSSVSVIEAGPEYAIPLAGVQPYIQNLTSGARTLELSASYDAGTLLVQNYSRVGIGYQIWRTSNLRVNPPVGSTVRITLKLLEGNTLISEAQKDLAWTRDYFYIVAGVIAILTGLGFAIPSLVTVKAGNRKPRR